MEWRIERSSDNQAVVYAAEELRKYLKRMDPDIPVAIMEATPISKPSPIIKLQIGDSDGNLPTVENPELDDAYYIDIHKGAGVIIGTNARSVLMGVYRFLYELGCRWPIAGANGEFIPQRKNLSDCKVSLSDKPSYRHRGVCIEGSCSFEHVLNMIEWLPKVGMNAYYNQFSTPFTFFDHWYLHKNNEYYTPEPADINEVAAMVSVLTNQIKKRGMLYHATGHGWTCDPIGIPGNSWDKIKYTFGEDVRELLAMVNGERAVYDDIALNTNLCYSNPKAREKIKNAIVEYCREHSEVDYLHFWLADGWNNHCECENCVKMRPSDFYVKILNEIDVALTSENIPTRIVFLIYVDLLWEPEVEKIHNEDRFTLMFAPITRTYSKSFAQDDSELKTKLDPYVRNKLTMPKSVNENIERLSLWQKQFSGDSFDYDYHLIWDHYHDPGGYESARILFEDMKNLDKLGLNGMVSCQVQRAFFPTGLAMNAMAAALWNKEQDFNEVAEAFFIDMFGEYALEMSKYFQTLSKMFNPPYLRLEVAQVCDKSAQSFAGIPTVINEMLPKFIKRLEDATDGFNKQLWRALIIHAQLCIYLALALREKALGKQDEAVKSWTNACDYIKRSEHMIHELFDLKYFIDVMDRSIRGEKHLT